MNDVKKRRTTTMLLVAGAIVLSLGTGFWIPRFFHAVGPLDEEILYESRQPADGQTDSDEGVFRSDLPGSDEGGSPGGNNGENNGDRREPEGREPSDSGKTVSAQDASGQETTPRDDGAAGGIPPLSDEAWMQQRIREVEDQVAPEDLEDFRRITGKLDMGRVETILADGITEEATEELRVYLRSRLTSEEYVRARDLFAAYLHLLTD